MNNSFAVLPRLLINQYVSQKLARFECMNNNTDVIDFFEEYEQFKLKLEKHTEEYKKKKLQEKKYLWKVIVDTSGCSRLDNINQTVLNIIELSKVFPKEKIVDDVDERTMDSSFIKKLLNVVSVVKELRDMNFCISENTLSRFYRRVCTELSSVVKQNVNTLVFGCYSNILFYYTSNNPVFNSFRMDRFRRLEM
ncbi:hypothetical protein RhiirA5_420592 [Rhizophagus irregularis]|uniref:Uncharacterized protein n=1 Tax=Rhizophagus irregularis TaxID=588596 RepID=A0A2I1DXZ1_9GLOM|nr:hypothetical protein RhiirA5_420592 [Rhizophagus irregularis]PKY14742.1 hypothetical protein RhiirB3_426815 [Rhizophagus irregularis]